MTSLLEHSVEEATQIFAKNVNAVRLFCEISTLLLTGTTHDKSKVEISRNFVAFSEYMNFKHIFCGKHSPDLIFCIALNLRHISV